MMRLICVFFLFLSTAAMAQVDIDAEFDARSLSPAENRLVQAALAFSGDYVGLLDGAWGKGSQQALEAYTLRTDEVDKPRLSHVREVLRVWEDERVQNDWQMVYLQTTDTSYAHPFGLLAENPDKDVIQFDASDDSFSLTVDFGDQDSAASIHRYVMGEALTKPEPYQNYRDDRLITSVSLAGDLLAYVRSDWVGNGYVTLSIFTTSAHQSRMALMAGSMQRGAAPDLTIPKGGVLAELMGDVAVAAADPAPEKNPFGRKPPVAVGEIDPNPFDDETPSTPFTQGAQPDTPDVPDSSHSDEATSTGTGFFINDSHLVTAAHVVAGCRVMELASGAVVDVIASDDDLDLAVLASPEQSGTWLELSADAAARLGEPVTALGYPYLGQFGQGLTVTGGNVSALPGGTFGETQLMISAPVQPGNSGGPLLNGDGAVIGVVVARINDMVVFEETGTLPQNMNFAVTNGTLTDFLKGAGVMFPAATGVHHDMAKGVPDAVSGAVVPVFCFE
jgi:serine protease Do